MKQEVLHDNLLKAIREKLPYEENLASVLGNLLCIGKEAIYRRLRGDVPFTLLETAQISKEMNISIDGYVFGGGFVYQYSPTGTLFEI